MKDLKENKNIFKRVLFAGLCIIVLLFILYNIFWISYVKYRFDPFTENLPKENDSILLSTDGMSYSVTKPRYLSLTGNLAVINESTHEGIIIWPEFPAGYKYATVLNTGVDEKDGSEIPQISIIQIDGNGVWADHSGVFGEKEKEVVRERQADIQAFIKAANELWNLADEN